MGWGGTRERRERECVFLFNSTEKFKLSAWRKINLIRTARPLCVLRGVLWHLRTANDDNTATSHNGAGTAAVSARLAPFPHTVRTSQHGGDRRHRRSVMPDSMSLISRAGL